jgi:lipoyl(octanoyl) transferase
MIPLLSQTKYINKITNESTGSSFPVVIKHLGFVDYLTAWQAMKDFTAQRTCQTPDEIWLLEHPPVYTQGIAGRPEHLLHHNGIPVIKTDRGGQITYHGPGQVILYLLLDLYRWQLNVRQLVRKMEGSVIDLLSEYHIDARGRVDAPGVYVDDAKIAALGLKIRHGACYHGIALNVEMNLTPFTAINPCGYPGLRITQVRDLGVSDNLDILGTKLVQHFLTQLTNV